MKRYVVRTCGVYAITCTANNQVYIGSSVNIFTRMRNHKSDLTAGRHYNSKMQRAFDKYGENSFEFSPIWADCKTPTEARELEAFVANKIGTFNLREVDPHSGLGSLSEETKAKLRAAMLGRKCGPRSAETCAKISKALQGKAGPKRSEEFKENLRAYHKGRERSPEHKESLRIANSNPEKHARISATMKATLARKKMK